MEKLSKKALERKAKKPSIEKNRRARINNCLEQLKTFILESSAESSRHSKLEKADILEMTVQYLQTLRAYTLINNQQQQTISNSPNQTHHHQYNHNSHHRQQPAAQYCNQTSPRQQFSPPASLHFSNSQNLHHNSISDTHLTRRPSNQQPQATVLTNNTNANILGNAAIHHQDNAQNLSISAMPTVQQLQLVQMHCLNQLRLNGFALDSSSPTALTANSAWRPW